MGKQICTASLHASFLLFLFIEFITPRSINRRVTYDQKNNSLLPPEHNLTPTPPTLKINITPPEAKVLQYMTM